MAVQSSEVSQAGHKLAQLKRMTAVVADTGELEAIRKYQPQDATTNPSLLLKAAALPECEALIREAVDWARKQADDEQAQLAWATDRLAVLVGSKILDIIPGRVSTEVDARLSFDTRGTLGRARRLIDMYNELGIDNDRILIKVASTWEGIRAAEQLEKEGINCNLTLLFSFIQAVACADAGVFLVSPFVGRILDWYKQNTGQDYTAENDPGVLSVQTIYRYFKQHEYKTVVMGASFRNTGEIEQLAGCDRLTISPKLMQELEDDDSPLERKLAPEMDFEPVERFSPNEKRFRWDLNEDAMATEKLAEGIRRFAADQVKLEALLKEAV